MVYDPSGLYPMGYDPHSAHGGAYPDPMNNMYFPQAMHNQTEVRILITEEFSLIFIDVLVRTRNQCFSSSYRFVFTQRK